MIKNCGERISVTRCRFTSHVFLPVCARACARVRARARACVRAISTNLSSVYVDYRRHSYSSDSAAICMQNYDVHTCKTMMSILENIDNAHLYLQLFCLTFSFVLEEFDRIRPACRPMVLHWGFMQISDLGFSFLNNWLPIGLWKLTSKLAKISHTKYRKSLTFHNNIKMAKKIILV